MKNKLLCILMAAMVLTLAACNKQPTDPNPAPKSELPTSTEPANIVSDNASAEVKANNDFVLMSSSINIPNLTVGKNSPKNINDYYAEVKQNLETNWATYEEFAKKEYTEKADGFVPYSLNHDISVLKNDAGYITIRRQITEFAGGVHESNTLKTENWVRSNDDYVIISLGDIFEGDAENGKKQLLDLAVAEANDREAEEPGLYFEGYEELMREGWNDSDFYLTETGVGMIFQEYSIGPYTIGAQTFEIPYSRLKDIKNLTTK